MLILQISRLMDFFLFTRGSFLSLVPVTGPGWRAQYEVVEFQPRAEDHEEYERIILDDSIYSDIFGNFGVPKSTTTVSLNIIFL